VFSFLNVTILLLCAIIQKQQKFHVDPTLRWNTTFEWRSLIYWSSSVGLSLHVHEDGAFMEIQRTIWTKANTLRHIFQSKSWHFKKRFGVLRFLDQKISALRLVSVEKCTTMLLIHLFNMNITLYIYIDINIYIYTTIQRFGVTEKKKREISFFFKALFLSMKMTLN